MSWTTNARRGLLAAAFLMLLGAGAGPAEASSVRRDGDIVVYRAGPGEVNRIWVSSLSPRWVQVSAAWDETLEALPPCREEQGQFRRWAMCDDLPLDTPRRVYLDTGDGDDTVNVDAAGFDHIAAAELHGGAGNDRMHGGNSDDVIVDGDGNDWVSAWRGNDTLRVGLGADLLFGYDGYDVADYGARRAPVSLSLNEVADDGEPGEGDNLDWTIEHLIGGHGDDTLTGGRLSGGLVGGDGDDALDGGAGTDLLFGGGGNDAIQARDGTRDEVSCGEGTDSVTADAADALDADCEHVDLGLGATIAALPAIPSATRRPRARPVRPPDRTPPDVRLARTALLRRGTSVRVRLSCPAAELDGCSGWVRLFALRGRARGATLGAGSFNVLGGRSAVVPVGISRSGRRLLRGRRAVLATVESRDGGGNVARLRARVALAR